MTPALTLLRTVVSASVTCTTIMATLKMEMHALELQLVYLPAVPMKNNRIKVFKKE